MRGETKGEGLRWQIPGTRGGKRGYGGKGGSVVLVGDL